MRAVFSGTRLRPAVELNFSFYATHPVTGQPLREWIRDIPGRAWVPERKTWTVTALGATPDKTLTDAGFTTVVGPDDEPMSLAGYTAPLVTVDPEHPGFLCVYPRLAGQFHAAPQLPGTAIWRAEETRWLVSLHDLPGGVPKEFILSAAAAAALDPARPALTAINPARDQLLYDGTLDGLRGVPVTDLRNVDRSTATAMSKLDITSVYDLLHHVPRRYIDRSNPALITNTSVGCKIAVLGTVDGVTSAQTRAGSMSKVSVRDTAGTAVFCTWFNAAWITRRFTKGDLVVLHGRLDTWTGKGGVVHFGMNNPLMDTVETTTAVMVPVYPASAKAEISTWQLHRAGAEAVSRMGEISDTIPAQVLAERDLLDRTQAYTGIHLPTDPANAEAARRRLAYDELLGLQLTLRNRRDADRPEGSAAVAHTPTKHLSNQLIGSLPFELTAAQRRVANEVARDMRAPTPMHRMIQGEVGSGKAQPLTSLILTPTGFTPMGEMQVGTEVINPTGEITTVTGVYPQGIRNVYRVTFSDGTTVESDDEHLWQVQTSASRAAGREPKIKTLREIRHDLRAKNGANKWHVQLPKAADLEGFGDRPVDPYLLGLLLGDGCLKFGQVVLSSADPELIKAAESAAPEGVVLRPVKQAQDKPRYDWRFVYPKVYEGVAMPRSLDDIYTLTEAYQSGLPVMALAKHLSCSDGTVRKILVQNSVTVRRYLNPMVRMINELGLRGTGSHTKFVPTAYLNAPIKDRLAVLQGLLDTDGTLNRRTGSNISITLASQQLSEDVAWLVRSLGGRAIAREIIKSGRVYWKTSLSLPAKFPPFRLRRKLDLLRPRTKYAHPMKAIVAVDYVGVKPVQCISVAHPNHLYVTDHFTITHNTMLILIAMLLAVESGHQGAIMVPTEILATQHHLEVTTRMAGLTKADGTPVRIELLTNKVTGAPRRAVLAGLADGSIDIVIGTHALLAPVVTFASLSLAVIDEQHRFGVEQRATLRHKGPDGRTPDMLVATATPIPRTAVMSIFGDLEHSVLDEMPPGRSPITTCSVEATDADCADDGALPWQLIREQVAAGHQAFVVCPMVSDSETKTAAAAENTAAALSQGALRGLRIGVAHGKQPAVERTAVMAAFTAGELDVLVATTVIEVGVNVPAATVMVITGAERFGLAQMHQMRGRVGRGQWPGHCVLVGTPKTADATQRIDALCASTDGFALAEVDLRIRGWGTLLGASQAGAATELRVADILTDTDLVSWARQDAITILEADPHLARRPGLRDEIRRAVGEDAAEWLTSA